MRTLIVVLAVLCLVGCSSTQTYLSGTSRSSAEGPFAPSPDPRDPSWIQMAIFLGADKNNNAAFKDFATKFQLKEYSKGPSGGFNTHGHSASMLYDANRISRIIISPQQSSDEFRPFSGTLPYNISRADGIEEIMARFGKPWYKQKDEHISYRCLNLRFSFMNGKVSEIILDYD